MEKIKLIVVTLFLAFINNIHAQNPPIVRKGLIRAMATISPSKMFGDGKSYFYLHGNLEGYVSDNISIVGEGYYYLGIQSSGNSTFNFNHSLFFGASKHFTFKNNDLYIGLQPGFSFTQLNAPENNIAQTHLGLNPLASSVIGYNFYVNKIFHFFIQSRVLVGEHNYDARKNLSEFRFSAGLGFNVNTLKINSGQ